jgi:nucleotide-binding universal stress UspA family protein
MTSPPLACILAATDLSPNATNALERAAHLARSQACPFHVIHIIDPTAEDFDVDEARQLLEHQTANLEPTPKIAVRRGHPFVEIVDHARELDADLIVVGARGWHSLTERMIGTTAERVVRHGDRPVLVVRSDLTGDYRRILVGVDLSDASADAFRFTCSVFPDAEIAAANICVVVGEHRLLMSGASDDSINELRRSVTETARSAFDAWFDAHQLAASTHEVLPGWPSSDLVALADRDGYDLVVVASRGMTGIHYVLLGSVAQRVLRDASGDVLIVRSGSLTFP